jgi:hypothetical protein
MGLTVFGHDGMAVGLVHLDTQATELYAFETSLSFRLDSRIQ